MNKVTAIDVRGYIVDLLINGSLASNARLPTERELSEATGASRRVVRQALASIEAEGLIWRRQGKGTFAGQPIEPVSALAAEINQTAEPIEVMEARLCIEPEIAALCATRATSDEVARMWALAHLHYDVKDDEVTELWDSALHRLIARCARNRPLQTAYTLLDDTRASQGWQGMRARTRSESSLRETMTQHIAIVRAIEAGDANAARNAMRDHLLTRINAMFAAAALSATVPVDGDGTYDHETSHV